MSNAVFIFTPSHAQHEHLEMVFDSIAKYISIPYQFCLFTDKVSKDFTSKHNVIIKTISEKDLKKCEHYYLREGRADIPPFSAYAQFLLPRYFSEYESFLYMEVDQIVRGDLAKLWLECRANKPPLAAAIFLDHNFKQTTVHSFNKINPNAKCFNTGVLYVDVNYWLTHNFESLCFDELRLQLESNGKRFEFYAQGAINNALHTYIYEFPWIYNVTGLGHVRGLNISILKSAKILHWTGSRKPWKFDGLYRDLYYENEHLKNNSDYHIPFPLIQSFILNLKHRMKGYLTFK